LEDCGHIVELSGMQGFLKSKFEKSDEEEEQGNNQKLEIQLPECPKCKKTIRVSQAFSKYVKEQLRNIENVKAKYFGKRDLIENEKLELLIKVRNEIKTSGSIGKTFVKFLQDSKTKLGMDFYVSMKNRWNLLIMLRSFIIKNQESINNMGDWQREYILFEIEKVLSILEKHNIGKKENDILFDFYSDQKMRELNDEIKRIEAIFIYFQFDSQFKKTKNSKELDKNIRIFGLLSKLESRVSKRIVPFSDVENEVEQIFTSLSQELKTELTREEKAMIHKAMGFSQGHWFNCPNGHPYCITECGGAMQESKCPECGAEIGGSSHALLSTNTLNRDMDGATHAAWSDTANNMANWQMNFD
jgi:hypothetical protein